jgi:hypothetical protein
MSWALGAFFLGCAATLLCTLPVEVAHDSAPPCSTRCRGCAADRARQERFNVAIILACTGIASILAPVLTR